jgi:hypothetical protein
MRLQCTFRVGEQGDLSLFVTTLQVVHPRKCMGLAHDPEGVVDFMMKSLTIHSKFL